MISRHLALVALATVFVLAACGDGGTASRTPTVPASPAATGTATGATSTSAAATPTMTATLQPESSAIPAVTIEASATPPPSGGSGIEGIATIGPTCPVERPDSPCPDRPYEARITFWRGGSLVAETRSGTDGRFRLALPPGTYRVVGESEAAIPHAVQQSVTVAESRWTALDIRYDSGIR